MVELKEIGVIHTPYKDDKDIPHQAYLSEESGEIEVFKEYQKALKDIEDFSHLIILYQFHEPIDKSSKEKEGLFLKTKDLLVNPFLDNKFHGIFSTRSPNRPNPIGLSIVELVDRNKNILCVRGVDVLDKTPLLDIKPYVPKFDNRKNVKTGWLSKT